MLHFNYFEIRIGELEIEENMNSYSIGVAHTKKEDCNFFGSGKNCRRINKDVYREFVYKIDKIYDGFSGHFIAGECKSTSDTFIITENVLKTLLNIKENFLKKYRDIKILREPIEANELLYAKDYFFTLLNFMIFWVNWALEKCEKPGFYISLRD